MVRCKDCGLLAVHDFAGRGAHTATNECREQGLFRDIREVNSGPADVFCYDNQPCFPLPERSAPAVVRAINTELLCGAFRSRCEGRTPQEHHEMSVLEEVQREHQREREEAAKWQRQIEALAERRHRETRNDLVSFQNKYLWLTALIGIATVVATVLSFVALLKGR